MGSDEDWSEEESSDDEELNIEEKRRKKEEKKFLDLCYEGDVESVKTLLAEDPSLINSKDGFGKS